MWIIKSEEELILEFGIDWREVFKSRVGIRWKPEKDVFLGQRIANHDIETYREGKYKIISHQTNANGGRDGYAFPFYFIKEVQDESKD
jgi:hypothetical protein